MPRYIDADDFEADCRKRYCTGCENYNGIKCKSCWVDDMLGEVEDAPTISPDEVRGVGEWEDAGKQMLINLENAREQYSVLGYPHRTESKRRCSVCRKITLVDASVEYKYCPHCGARMKGE